MKLLIVTQKIDKAGGYFSFFHEWLVEFSKQCESLTVISLEVGEYDLPKNVKVFSLGKESGHSRLKYVYRLWKYSWKERKNYDAVFAHMSPLYVIFGFPVWKLCGKKISMWYVHKHVDFKLRVATVLSDVIFSAVPESFRIKNSKVRFMGQAVPLQTYARPQGSGNGKNDVFSAVAIGRITPIKNLDTLIEAAALLRDDGTKIRITIVGEPVTPGDIEYKEKLTRLVADKHLESVVDFRGKVSVEDLPSCYWKSDISINLCPTGGLDKVVLESMASGTPVIVSNEAFRGHFGAYANDLIFRERDGKDCAEKIKVILRAQIKKPFPIFF